ncbi:MAG: hypothetical protein GY697_15085, partial [Desulfobacterales bacterium]|nr:hypothetical protein [Desulfobacterales bacterium]
MRTAKAWLRLSIFIPTVVILLVLVTCLAGAGVIAVVNGGPGPAGQAAAPETAYFQGSLKVMTLNMAHGRKTAFSQIFLSTRTIQKNLEDIGTVLKTTAPDIVALQEADGPSWWSGNFDHVAFLAQKAGLPWYSRAGYMDKWSLHYGTALLASRPYLETRAHRFEASWPTPLKGFLLGRFGW